MAVATTLCPVLVGRERELTELEDALLAAIRGEGRMLLLGGDAGMGKTRLTRELEDRARAIGVTTLSGGCSEAELALPYLPFLQALGNYVAQADLSRLRAQLGASAVELGKLFPRLGRAPADAGDPVQAKLRFYEAILHLLEVGAGESGLLLVVEDLHSADASTLELLDYLARRVLTARVLVLGTYRPDEIHRRHPLWPRLQDWRRKGLTQTVTLHPLGSGEVRRMVDAIFDEATQYETAEFLHERCEGNPFVLEELLKEALERGDFYRTEHGWERKELHELRLPETVRETILLRLERLEPAEVRMLRAAAVLGDVFQDSTLIAVAGQDRETVQEALRVSVQGQLLEEADGSGTYQFRHSLTREAVYEDLVAPERQEYHRRAAQALRALRSTNPVQIAHHLFAAGRADEAIPLCLEAARRAQETWALLDAVELYERALPHVHEPKARAHVLHDLGRCLTHVDRRGAATAAEGCLQEAVRLLEDSRENVDAARVRVTLALARYPRLRHAQAEAELQQAVSVLEPLGLSSELAEAYNHLAFFRIVDLDGSGCQDWAAQALRVAEATGAGVARVRAQNLLGLGLACEGRVDEALQRLDRSAAAAVRNGWNWYALSALNNTLVFLPLERWDELAARLERMEAVDARHFATLACHAWAWVGRGFPARAAEMAERARRAAASQEWAVSVFWASCTLVRAYASMGRIEDAKRALPPMNALMHRQDQLSRWAAELHLTVVTGEAEPAIAAPRPVQNLVTGWPWALERTLALQDLVDAGALEQVESDLRSAPDGAFLQAARIDLWRARGNHRAVLAAGPEFVELTERVGARFFGDRARLALVEARVATGDRHGGATLLQEVMLSAQQREHWWQQQQCLQLAQELGIEPPAAAAAPPPEEPRPTGERFVTVLFADVRGYSRITQAAAPALMADKIASFQRSVAKEVARHHGTVDKFAGDAVMATFNVSGASIDHANHALLTAVAIRDRARYLGLPLGIGIATGPAIVGRLSEGANLSVLGETTNLASRLQSQARPGEILLNDTAWRRLRQRVNAKLEELELKGFEGKVAAYRVT